MSTTPNGYHIAPGYPGATPCTRPCFDYLCRFLLSAYGIQRVGTTKCGSPIVSDATYPSGGDWWVLADNGGELNVCRINDKGLTRSVPYIQGNTPTPIGRVAWFCRCVMQGVTIEDWMSCPLDDVVLADLSGCEA